MQSAKENRHRQLDSFTDAEFVSGGKSINTRFTVTDTSAAAASAVAEHMVQENKVVVAAAAVNVQTEQLAAIYREKKYSSFPSSLARSASSRIKQVSKEVKRLATLTRRPPPEKSAAARYALNGLKFISKTEGGAAWATVEQRFDELTSTTDRGLLPRSLFGECIGMSKECKEFAGVLFDALARRNNITGDLITREELKRFWNRIADESFDSRLQTFLDMVDKNADGKISEDELREIICLSASANNLSNIQKQADEYARLMMEELDPGNLGFIKIENLEMLLMPDPNLLARGRGKSRNLSIMLSEKLKPTRDHPLKTWYRDFNYFLVDNWQRFWVVALWIGIMAALFAYQYVQYRKRDAFDVMGHCVCMAKGAAETLKLNMALILLPVCRNILTWLRNKTRLGVAVPFDDNLNFHKVIAVAIAIGVGVHGISHLACDFPRLLNASPEKYKPMEPYFGEQPASYWYFVKGCEGVTGIIMVVLMAISFTLASPWLRRRKEEKSSKTLMNKILNKLTGFNAFWYTHHLFIVVYSLLIVHGVKLYLAREWYKKTTWMYLAVPMTLYGGERLVRTLRSRARAVSILQVPVYPGNVLVLHMSKPQGFKYKSGQYIFVKCAAVSPFEWHPFSITTAPDDNFLSVHIRIVGDWTRQLKTVFSKVCQQPSVDKSQRADSLQEGNNPIFFPRVLIDGPYGAPTQDYKDYDVVLLVGLGIGATPMISVVRDIINNIRSIEEEENSLEGGTRPPTPKQKTGSNSSSSHKHEFRTRKAYFYWVTREQGSFDWFKDVMNEAADMDHKGVIEMHNHCTSVYEEGDARSALIKMLQSIYLAKNGLDVVSGTRVVSHFAKPNWSAVYKRIADNHPDTTVGVFFCGAPAPVKELRQLASDFSHNSPTTFVFHKENF